MPRTRHKPEEVVAKLRRVVVVTAQGTPLAEAIRSIAVAEVTYHRWSDLSPDFPPVVGESWG